MDILDSTRLSVRGLNFNSIQIKELRILRDKINKLLMSITSELNSSESIPEEFLRNLIFIKENLEYYQALITKIK